MTRKAFTLIELLVVIAIIAILAVVVVLTLNPGQLILQTRDNTRLQDLATLQDAIGLYQQDAGANGTLNLGVASTVYVSIASVRPEVGVPLSFPIAAALRDAALYGRGTFLSPDGKFSLLSPATLQVIITSAEIVVASIGITKAPNLSRSSRTAVHDATRNRGFILAAEESLRSNGRGHSAVHAESDHCKEEGAEAPHYSISLAFRTLCFPLRRSQIRAAFSIPVGSSSKATVMAGNGARQRSCDPASSEPMRDAARNPFS